MTSDRLGFAVVGCGAISKKHLQVLSSHVPGAEVIAVCDVSEERARQTAEQYGTKHYTDYVEMLEAEPGIDVVNVLTPSGDHAEVVVKLTEYVKNIVVEKPLALNLDDAERMIRACDRRGVRLSVVQQNRYNQPVQQLKRAIVAGRFGKMVSGSVRVRWCRTQEYYDQAPWRGTWLSDGGVLANQANHHIDLLTWVMGEVESVFAYTATRLVNIEADDTAVAVLKFSDGALGVVEATTATRPADLEGSISVLGENGAVEIGGFAADKIKTWQFSDFGPEDEAILERSGENPEGAFAFGHVQFLSAVVQTIREGKGGVVDGLEALNSLTLINAMYESMETGREVKLRFRPKWAKLGK